MQLLVGMKEGIRLHVERERERGKHTREEFENVGIWKCGTAGFKSNGQRLARRICPNILNH